MIRGRRSPWAIAALHAYVRWSAGRRFAAWRWAAEDEAALRDLATPLLFLPNHSSWWDGFLAFELAAALGHTQHLMMQADQLARYRFFARCGAFSVDRDRPRQAHQDLIHAATLLTPGAGVWLFPQGRLASPFEHPLRLEGGAARLALMRPGTRLVPTAFRFVFLAGEKPEAYALFGRPWAPDPGESRRAVQARLEGALDETLGALDAALAGTRPRAFQTLIGKA